jgi:hypothetical protein
VRAGFDSRVQAWKYSCLRRLVLDDPRLSARDVERRGPAYAAFVFRLRTIAHQAIIEPAVGLLRRVTICSGEHCEDDVIGFCDWCTALEDLKILALYDLDLTTEKHMKEYAQTELGIEFVAFYVFASGHYSNSSEQNKNKAHEEAEAT